MVIVPRLRRHYRNFNVVRAKSANTSEAIQKRTITFDSLQPNLEDDRQRLNDEDASDERQQQFLLDQHRHGADGSAQRERANIAHKDFGRMGVIPEEANGRADHGAAENRQLRDLGNLGNLQVVSEQGMSTDVGQHGQRPGRDHGAANRQAVEAVGEVHGIARTDDDDHHEDQERNEGYRPKMRVLQAADHQVRPEMLEKRHNQPRGVQAIALQADQDDANRQRG